MVDVRNMREKAPNWRDYVSVLTFVLFLGCVGWFAVVLTASLLFSIEGSVLGFSGLLLLVSGVLFAVTR